jgi:hypothetical protein
MIRKLFASAAAVALMAGFTSAAELKSGPQPGEKVPGPFSPLNVNGATPGEKQCLVCRNGANPVVMIFARDVSNPAVRKLIKKVDAATAKHSACEMGSFVVVLTDDDTAADKLKKLADKEQLKKLVLSVDNPQGPVKYKIAKDAALTVVLYNKHEVKANHTFKKGELKDGDINTIIRDVAKITPAK